MISSDTGKLSTAGSKQCKNTCTNWQQYAVLHKELNVLSPKEENAAIASRIKADGA